MSDATDHIAPEDESRVLAAEYVLGVLSAEERRAVEARMAEQASFAREVEDWEERLGGMASYVSPATPPAHTWFRIQASLGAQPLTTAIPAPSIWQSLTFWRGLQPRLVGAGRRLRRRAGLCRHAADDRCSRKRVTRCSRP